MPYYTIKRLLAVLPMLLLVSVLVFLGMELMPGDPLSYLISPDDFLNQQNDLSALRATLGLDRPVYVRYFQWIGRMFHGDFGYSLATGARISDMIGSRLPATLELCGTALLVSSILGLSLGFLSSIKQNSAVDYANTTLGMLGISIPDFFFAMSGIVIFAVKLHWLPVGGRLMPGGRLLDRLPNLVMPSLVLGFSMTAALMRTVRGSMLDVLNNDYIKTARSKGLPRWRIYVFHALRNALTPVMMLLCFRLPLLVGGAVVVESVFSWGGMGQMILQGVSSKDYPVVMISVVTTAVAILLVSVLVDILTAVLDPRVRLG